MSSPTYSTIIYDFAAKIEAIGNTFSIDGYKTLAEWVQKPFGAACLLFIVLKGLAIVFGLIKEPMSDLGKAAIRIGFIYSFAMNWGMFSSYAVDFFTSISESLSATMMNINALHFPMPSGVGVKDGMQKVLTELISVGNWTIAKGSLVNPGPLLSGIAIYFAGGAVIGLAFFEIMGAKLFLSILFCLAPIFISLTLFEQTRTYFDKWFGYLTGFTFVMIMVSSVVGISMALLHWTASDLYLTQAKTISSVGWVPILLCAMFCVKAIKEASSMGLAMGGACSHGHGGEMMAGALGMMGVAKGVSGKLPSAKVAATLTKLGPVGMQKMVVGAATKMAGSVNAIRKNIRGNK
tara:strand:+ start:45 stop:1091 length:1047 start_codon:yes stop_codon:yes gene_type:complete